MLKNCRSVQSEDVYTKLKEDPIFFAKLIGDGKQLAKGRSCLSMDDQRKVEALAQNAYGADEKLKYWADLVESKLKSHFVKAGKGRGQTIRPYQQYVASDLCKRILAQLGDSDGQINLAWTLDSG